MYKRFTTMLVGALLCSSVSFAENLPFKCSVGFVHPYTAPYDIDHCPADIQEWLERADTCSRLHGLTHPDDIAEAKEEIMNEGWGIEELQCSKIACDFSALFSKYEGDIVYTGILIDFEKLMHGENGVLKCDEE